jgi:hypothetical protein
MSALLICLRWNCEPKEGQQEGRPARPSPFPCRDQTQTEAAACILVSVRTWQDYEQGRRKMPPGLWEYYCLQCAFPSEMDKLITRWRHIERSDWAR